MAPPMCDVQDIGASAALSGALLEVLDEVRTVVKALRNAAEHNGPVYHAAGRLGTLALEKRAAL